MSKVSYRKLQFIVMLLMISLAGFKPSYAGNVLATGNLHACAIQEDETLICWGDDADDKLGSPAGTFSQIDAGFYFTCGLKTDGSISCWGKDTVGETSPPGGHYKYIATGAYHACALDDYGEAICWGANDKSQSSWLSGPFQALSLGNNHSCGLSLSNAIECWGSDEYGQSGPVNGEFDKINAGFDTTCGVTLNGTASCWGRFENTYGFLKDINFGIDADTDGLSNQSTNEISVCGLKTDNTINCPVMESTPNGVFSYLSTGGDARKICYSSCNAYYAGYHSEFRDYACGVRDNGIIACWGVNVLDRATPPVGTKAKQPSNFISPPKTECEPVVIVVPL